jgi:hypothetical protein
VYYYLTNSELSSGLQSLNKPIEVDYEKLKNPNSYTYSYQCWIYISNPPNSGRTLFARGNSNTDASNNFEVKLTGQSLVLSAGSGIVAPTQIMTITDSFPIQKWTYLVINVYNLKTFEAYINGKLAKTVHVQTAPIPSSTTSNLTIGNSGLSGYATKFFRKETTLDAKTVWNTYLSGNGLNNMFASLIPYGMNMSISKGEDVQRVVKIF